MWWEFRVSLRPERRGGFYSPGGGPEHATSSPVPGRGDNDVKASRGPGVRPRARLMDGLIRRRVMSAAFVDTTRPALGARGDLRDSAPVSCASPTCRLLFSKCTGFLCFPALPEAVSTSPSTCAQLPPATPAPSTLVQIHPILKAISSVPFPKVSRVPWLAGPSLWPVEAGDVHTGTPAGVGEGGAPHPPSPRSPGPPAR